MTRKKLPKAIRGGDLYGIAATAVDEEAPMPPSRTGSAPKASSGAAVPAVPDPFATRRRAYARRIVERHKMYAAMGGLFPLAVVNVAGVTAVIMRMLKALSDLYQVPFERERTRSIIIGLMGGAVPTGLGAAAASTLVFAVPGAGFVGLAVSSVSAAAFTRGIGLVFVEQFEKGTMPLDGTAAEPA